MNILKVPTKDWPSIHPPMNLFSTAEGTCSEVSNARDNHHAPLFFFGIRTKYLSILSMYVKKRKRKRGRERERRIYIYIFIFFLNKYSIYMCVCENPSQVYHIDPDCSGSYYFIWYYILPWLQPSLEFFQLHSILAEIWFWPWLGLSEHGELILKTWQF